VALAVDDAGWLDRDSLLALVAALRDLAGAPLLLVLAVSPRIGVDGLDQLRARLGRDLDGAAVTLGPLDVTALWELARRILPTFTEVEIDRVVRRVGSDSAGVPLLAVELLRAVALGLDLGVTSGAWPEPLKTLDQTLPGDLPDAVVAAIRIGFRQLSPVARQVLAAASILDARVTPEVLARGADLTPGEVTAALDELEWHRWMVSEPRGYGFVARVVRQVIARDMLTPGQRRRILERLGRGE
jgi:predicted ATPase